MRAYAKSTAQHPLRAYFQLAPHNSTGSPQWRNWRNRVTTRTQIERTQTYGRHNTTHALNPRHHTSWELSVLKPHAGTGHAAHESLVYLSTVYSFSFCPHIADGFSTVVYTTRVTHQRRFARFSKRRHTFQSNWAHAQIHLIQPCQRTQAGICHISCPST